jgi:redox-sensing transcriptional repressor
MADGRLRRIPEATVARLPLYWRALLELAEARTPTVSSEGLAEMTGENAAKIRRDLSYLGSYGTRGAGYDVELLVTQIGRELGLDEDWPVVIVGVGNLGRALANYRGFPSRGFRVAALVDSDPAKVGQTMDGLVVGAIEELPALVKRERLAIGLIATPASAAQGVADRDHHARSRAPPSGRPLD